MPERGALVLLLLCLLALPGAGCERGQILADDLADARAAVASRNWPLAERLLERYLREDTKDTERRGPEAERRWEAWQLLLQVLNSAGPESRASLEVLEAMRAEYEDDDGRMADILEQMGLACERLRRYEQAARAWAAYTELAGIGGARRVEGFRHLAAMQFSRRRFEAGEESLAQCLALPLPDHAKIRCMLDLADQNMARERWQEVADLCHQVLDSGPDDEVRGLAGYLLADALEQLGRPREALVQFEAARDAYPNPAVMDNRIAHLRKTLKNGQ